MPTFVRVIAKRCAYREPFEIISRHARAYINVQRIEFKNAYDKEARKQWTTSYYYVALRKAYNFCTGECGRTRMTCQCPLPMDYFPLYLVSTTEHMQYLVHPSAEERAKLETPRQTETQTLLHAILQELRYNPDAGSRVANARAHFTNLAATRDSTKDTKDDTIPSTHTHDTDGHRDTQ